MNLIQSETRETEILRNFNRLWVTCYISIGFRDLLGLLSLPTLLQSPIWSLLSYNSVERDLS